MINIYEILQKIGFDWQVGLANLISFLIILYLLKRFAFKPIGKIIKQREDKITEGLMKAEEADVRMEEVDEMAKNKIKAANLESMNIIKNTEKKAKDLDQVLRKEVEDKQKELMNRVQQDYIHQKEAATQLISKEAVEIIKQFITKTVKLKPDQIDEALIKKAVAAIKESPYDKA